MKFFATVAAALLVGSQIVLGAPSTSTVVAVTSRASKESATLIQWFEAAMRSNYDSSLTAAQFDDAFDAVWGQDVTLQANGHAGLTRASLKAAIDGVRQNATRVELAFANVIGYLNAPNNQSSGIVAGTLYTTAHHEEGSKTVTQTIFINGVAPVSGVTTSDKRRIVTDVTVTVPKQH